MSLTKAWGRFPACPIFLLAALALFTSACTVGPKYQQPAAPVPTAFKEAPPEGWKEAQPADGVIRGKWWEVYNDAALNALEEQVAISNQNVLAAEANYRVAKAAVRVARSALFPGVTAAPAITASQTSTRASTAHFAPSGVNTNYLLPLDASWQVDLWGSIHRTVAANTALAQATEADLENARLLYQSELAMDYFQLHGTDGQRDLLDQTVKSYRDYLNLTRYRFEGGIATESDVAQAEAQLYGAESSLTDLGVQRTQLEHAVAVLIGKPPAEIKVEPASLSLPPPAIPLAVPSALLERRPDIASAERRVAAANEQIGIAKAAFFPTLTLGLTAGVQSASFINWLTWPSRFWSAGPQLAQVLFDAGRRRGEVQSAQAQYDAIAANYRQTVLTAFQQVEDNLAALRILQEESAQLDRATTAAERSLKVSTAQYTAGTATYLQVIDAQATVLQDRRSAIDVLTRRMTASVLLIEALGGGWDNSKLPSATDVRSSP